MKKILGIILVVLISNAVIAQEEGKKGKPDIPGTLLIDLGFSFLNSAPESMDTKFFGSKTINFYYQYDIPFGDASKFSVHPGVGIGIDKFSFDKDVILNLDTDYNVVLDDFATLFPNGKLKKSKWSSTYVDIPLEFRFHTNPDDKARSFKVGLGGRIGYLLNSNSKIKYTEDGTTIKLKNNQKFEMNTIRYGGTVRVGIGWFNLFYYHNFSDLFKSGEGPLVQTAITNYTVGLTIAGF
jgi:hypothetical protein